MCQVGRKALFRHVESPDSMLGHGASWSLSCKTSVVARTRYYKTTTQRVGNTSYKTVESRRTMPYGPGTRREAAFGAVLLAVIGVAVGVFYLTRSSPPTLTVAQIQQRLAPMCHTRVATKSSIAPKGMTEDVICDAGKTDVNVFLFKAKGDATQGRGQSHFWACAQITGGNWLANVTCNTTPTPTIPTRVAMRVQKALGGTLT